MRTIAFWAVIVGIISTIGVVTAQNPGPGAKPPDPDSERRTVPHVEQR